jgi:predicted ATP-dependent serine protease
VSNNAAGAWKCTACGNVTAEGFDACGKCGSWGGAIRAIGVQAPREVGSSRWVLLADAEPRPVFRLDVAEPWQTALGGGLAMGSSVLVDGRPKAGKTTEALRLACSLPGSRFIPCEPGQDASRLRIIAEREGLDMSAIYVAEDCRTLAETVDALGELPAGTPLAIVDSLSFLGDLEAWTLLRGACPSCALLCIMHVTKTGRMAGRNVLRHAADTTVHITKTALLVKENRFASGPDAVRVPR